MCILICSGYISTGEETMTRTCSLDIETNLAHDVIHMVWLHDWETGTTYECRDFVALAHSLYEFDTVAHWGSVS